MIFSRPTPISLLRNTILFLYLYALISVLFCTCSAWAVAPINIDIDIQAEDSTSPAIGTTAGPLAINRLELRFAENKQGDITIPVNGTVTPQATIKYTGNGSLRYQWLVDGRVMQQSSRTLVFGNSVEITTDAVPPFPTFEPGLHKVSLNLVNPVVNFTIPTISYFVDQNTNINSPEIVLYEPADESWVKPSKLRFAWSSLVTNSTYQVTVWPYTVPRKPKVNDRRRSSAPDKSEEAVFQSQTKDHIYQPGTVQLNKLVDGVLYKWQVSAFDNQGQLIASSPKRLFRPRSEYDQEFTGGIFLRNAEVVISAAADISGPIQEHLLQSSKEIDVQKTFDAGQTIYLQTTVENSTTRDQQDINLEIYNNDELISHRIIPHLPVHQRTSITTAWQVPTLINAGQLHFRVRQKKIEVDHALINWESKTSFSMPGLDFHESAAMSGVGELPSLVCSSTTSFLGTISLPDEFKQQFKPLSADLLSARVVRMESKAGNRQNLIDKGWFSADENSQVFFTAEISDLGFMDAYLEQRTKCQNWRKSIGQHLLNVANTLDPQDTNLRAVRPYEHTEKTHGKASICSHQSGLYKLSCLENLTQTTLARYSRDDKIATAAAARSDASYYSTQQFPDSYSLFFQLATTAQAEKQPPLVWKDDQAPFSLHKDDHKRIHNSSTMELPGDPGDFRLSLSGLAPLAPLYTTLAGGRPRFLEMAGFTLEVKTYETQANGTLKGKAITHWRGDYGQQEITVTFRDLAYTQNSPLHGQVTAGQAGLSGPILPLLSLGRDKKNAFPIHLNRLRLLADKADADLSFKLPSHFQDPGYRQVDFVKVPIFNGGEFLAEHRFPTDFKDIHLGRGDLDLRLAGSVLLIDFAEHLTNQQISTDPAWQGMVVGGGAIRALIRPRPDRPELGLMPAANIAYLLGRFQHLEMDRAGMLTGEAKVSDPTTMTAFFGQSTNHEVDLLAPLGFGLHFTAGVFQILEDGVGGLDLAGQLRLPSDYNSTPLAFSHLHRLIVGGEAKGFQTEDISSNLPRLDVAGFRYDPGTAKLIIPADIIASGSEKSRTLRPSTQNASTAVATSAIDSLRPKSWPQNALDLAKWQVHQKAKATVLAYRKSGGLVLSGGGMKLPWPAVPTPPAPSSGEEQSSATTTGTVMMETSENSTSMADLLLLESGVFCLNSSGINGAWLQSRDMKMHMIGDFKGRLDGLLIDVQHSSLVDSLLEGNLLIPYPTSTTLGFSASLDSDLNIIIGPDGFSHGQEINLAYWHATIKPGSALRLDRSSNKEVIHVEQAGMRLDVAPEYGGQEFMAPDQDWPFQLSLDIRPDGNIDNANMVAYPAPPTSATNNRILDSGLSDISGSYGANLLFLGHRFQPEAISGQQTPFTFQHYYGNHQAPAAGEAPSSEQLITLTGKLSTSLFGDRKVKILHTAQGAKVPYIEDKDESTVHISGVIQFNTKSLRFINSYPMSQEMIDTAINNSADSSPDPENPSSPFAPTTTYDSSTFSRSKSFVGLTELLAFRDIIKVTGISEAGIGDFKGDSDSINTCRNNCAYEKIGFGYGVDVGQAALDIIHIGGTGAEIAGGLVEYFTGWEEGTGKDVIDMFVEGESLINEFIVFYGLIAGDVPAGGTITSGVLDELRHVTNDALQFTKASLSLADGIYRDQGGNEYDLAVQGERIAQIMLEITSMAIQPEDLNTDRILQLLIDGADQILVSLMTMEMTNQGDTNFNDLESISDLESLSAELIALKFGRLPIRIANQYLNGGDVSPAFTLGIMNQSFDLSLGLLKLLNPEASSSGNSTELDKNVVYLLEFALKMAHQLTDKDMLGTNGEIDPRSLLPLLDTITELLCKYHDEISQGLGQIGVDDNTRQNSAMGLAASRLAIHNLQRLNEQLKTTPVIAKEVMVKDYILPIIDTLLGGGSNGLTPCSHEGPAESEDCGTLPPISDEVKLAMAIIKESLTIAMQADGTLETIPATAALHYLQQYLTIFENCQSLFPINLPFAKIDTNIRDLIRIIEPLEQDVGKKQEAKAALDLADVLMEIFEERADSMSEISLNRPTRALLHTVRAVNGAGLTAIAKGDSYSVTDAAHSGRQILNFLPEFTNPGTQEYAQTDTGTALLSEILHLVEKKNGQLNAMNADELLALAERALVIVNERMTGYLNPQQQQDIKISLMVLHYSRLALKQLIGREGEINAFLDQLRDLLPSEQTLLTYMNALSRLLEEQKNAPGSGGQETLAMLLREMIEEALDMGLSAPVEAELRQALLYLSQIHIANCKSLFLPGTDGNLDFIRITCADGVTRELNLNDNLLVLTFPAGNRYRNGGIEHYRVPYALDIEPYRADLAKPAGDPAREQALAAICSNLSPENLGTATMVFMETTTSNGQLVRWQALENKLTITASTPSCPESATYDKVLNVPSLNDDGTPVILDSYQLLGRTWRDESLSSCLQWQPGSKIIARLWDNGNQTSYIFHGLDGQYPQLDQVKSHQGVANWGGRQYQISYQHDAAESYRSTLEVRDPISGSVDNVLPNPVLMPPASVYQFDPDAVSQPQQVITRQKTIVQPGRTDVYDFEHQLFWRTTSPASVWEFYLMADDLAPPESIAVGQLPPRNISAEPQSYTLLVRMDGDTAYNPDGSELTEPIVLPNGVTLRPGSLHISINGVDFHSLTNNVTIEQIDGLTVEKATLDSGLIMRRWTDNSNIKHLKEEMPGIGGTIRQEVHTEELPDGTVRETITNLSSTPHSYIKRVRHGNQVETFTWQEGEQPVRQGEIVTLGQFVTAIDRLRNPIKTLPEIQFSNPGDAIFYSAAELFATTRFTPKTFSQLTDALRKLEKLPDLKASFKDNDSVRKRLSFQKATLFNNYLDSLIKEAGNRAHNLAQLRGQMGQCPEIEQLDEQSGISVPDCTPSPDNARTPFSEIITIWGVVESPENRSSLQMNREAIQQEIVGILGPQYRIAQAAFNTNDTALNRDLVIKVYNLAKSFGEEVLQAVAGEDEAPTIDKAILDRSCLSLSQASQELVNSTNSQALTETDLQRYLALVGQFELANCPTKEEMDAHPEENSDLQEAGYDPSPLDPEIMIPKIVPAYSQNCLGTTLGPESPDFLKRITATLCSPSNMRVICYCDSTKIWFIVNKIKANIRNEIEQVKAGEDDNIDYFENLSKTLKRLEAMTTGSLPLEQYNDSGFFGPPQNNQQGWDNYCKSKFGLTKEEYLQQYGSPPYCAETSRNPDGEESGDETPPDLSQDHDEVEAAIDQGIAAQEKKCLENQDLAACANAEKHKNRKKERTETAVSSTSAAITTQVRAELDSFCAAATDSENIIARLKHWQQIYRELDKQGFKELGQYDTMVNLWLEKVVADFRNGNGTPDDVKRVKCAINLTAVLGVLRVTGTVEDFLNDFRDQFQEKALYAAGWPVAIPLLLCAEMNLDDLQDPNLAVNAVKGCYQNRRQAMFDEKSPLAIKQFHHIGLAVNAMAGQGILFTRDDFFNALNLPSDDPQTALAEAVRLAIEESSACLDISDCPVTTATACLVDDPCSLQQGTPCLAKGSCGMAQVERLLSLAITAQSVGEADQAVQATAMAREILRLMFQTKAIGEIDFSEIRLLLEELLKGGEECRENVIALMATLYDGMTSLGPELSNYLNEFGQMLDSLALNINDLPRPVLPDLLKQLPVPPQFLDCTERIRLALSHLQLALDLAQPNEPGFPWLNLANTMSLDFSRAIELDGSIITGRAAQRAAELVAAKLTELLPAPDMSAVTDVIQLLLSSAVNQATGLGGNPEDELKPLLEQLLRQLLPSLLDDQSPKNFSSAALQAAINTTLQGVLDSLNPQGTNQGINFDLSALLNQLRDQLPTTGSQNQVLTLGLNMIDFLTKLPGQNGTITDDNAIALIKFIGQLLQQEQVQTVAGQANPQLPEILAKLGELLQNVGRQDFPIYLAGESVDYVVSTLWPDQPVIAISLNWATNYLLQTAQFDINDKLNGLNNDGFGIPNLVYRLRELPNFAALNLPTEIFTVPTAAMVSLFDHIDDLKGTETQRTEAIFAISADTLNVTLPQMHISDCGNLHPLACMVNTIGQSGNMAGQGGEDKLINLSLSLLKIGEQWSGSNLGLTSLISPIKDIAIAGNVPTTLLTALVKMPELTESVVKMVEGAPPQWQKYLDIFRLDCQTKGLRLAPPDRCKAKSPFTVGLAALENVRMDLLPDVYARRSNPSTVDQEENGAWSYLQTMPILEPPLAVNDPTLTDLASLLPVLDMHDSGRLTGPKEALVAYIDYSRMLLNLANSLVGEQQVNFAPRYADLIKQDSIFSTLIGEPGDFFSGAAGGLLMNGEPGKPMDTMAFEMVGSFTLPAVGSMAGQFTTAYGPGTFYNRIRGGTDVPDFGNLLDGLPNSPTSDSFGDFATMLDNASPLNLKGYLEGEFHCGNASNDMTCSLENMGISLDYIFDVDIMNKDVADVSMTGNLNGKDRSGDLCLESSIDLLMGIEGFTPIPFPSPVLSFGGGLWHHPTGDGTGFSIMGGISGRTKCESALHSANLTVGFESGYFLNVNGNNVVGGSCLRPFLQGSATLLNEKLFRITPDLDISSSIKNYTNNGEQHAGWAYTVKADGIPTNQLELLNPPEKQCPHSLWIFVGDETQTLGLGCFPEKTDDKPWGGLPAAAKETCDPNTNCQNK